MSDEVTPDAPVEAAPAAPDLAGPWAKDLQEYFSEKESIGLADVNAFMAEKYQPYVTRLEQESAPARALYKDLTEDFNGTMAALVHEVYEDEGLATRFLELVGQGATPEQAEAIVEEETQNQQPLPPEVQELVEERKLSKQQEAYRAALDGLKGQVNDPEFDENEFAPFVITADGNLDRAYTAYKGWRDAAKARWAPAAEPETPPAPPSPLGTSTASGGQPTPPVQKQYRDLGDALNDFMDEQRAARQAPTTVGTV